MIRTSHLLLSLYQQSSHHNRATLAVKPPKSSFASPRFSEVPHLKVEHSLPASNSSAHSLSTNSQLESMALRVITYGIPSALALGGAFTASTLLASDQSNESSNNRTPASGTISQGSVFDFNATFLGQTLSYKKNQVVSTVKEVGKEIKQASAKAIEGSK